MTMTSSVAVGMSLGRISSLNTSNSYGINEESNQRQLMSTDDKRKYILMLLEDLESFVNEDHSDHKYFNELIARVCQYLRSEGSGLDEDMSGQFRQSLDVYFNLLRNVLRNPKLNPISRAMILEVIELRASNWSSNQEIENYYRKKRAELETNDSYSSLNDLNRPLKTSHSSGALMSSSVANEILKSSGKLNKVAKVSSKTFLKDEVVIRNGDSGKVTPGAKERLVQITGTTKESIERAKELIENTIKRNASPVPFDCPNKGFDLNQNNETNENELFDTKSGRIAESEHKMQFNFNVEVGEDVIQLATNNSSLGLKAKQILQNCLNPSNKSQKMIHKFDSLSDSDDNNNEKENVFNTEPKKEKEFQEWKQWSAIKMATIDPKLNQIQRSSSQGTVPMGRTSMRFLSQEVPKRVVKESTEKITYDRQFLLSCAESPFSQNISNIEMMTKICTKAPNIIRHNGAQQNSLIALNKSQSFTQSMNGIEIW